jgi:NTP pyrophosphatase (non-canonical NTP hydrolase)
METTLSKCAELVWKFREENDEHWLTPDKRDSMRYAYSEMGEAYSEYMRETRSKDLRNREKASELEPELADCVIMLVTALGNRARSYQTFRTPDFYRSMDDGSLMDFIAFEVALALDHTKVGGNARLNIMLALTAIEFLLRRRDVSLEDLVGRKLEALKEKIERRLAEGAGDG